MEQKFELTKDNKVKWSFREDVDEHKDKEFGKVGTSSRTQTIIFDSKEIALAVLERDLADVQLSLDKFGEDMNKSKHSLDKFTDLKDLILAIGKLHNEFKEATNVKVQSLYADNPKKYQKILSQFNSSKEYIKDELASVSIEYGKFLEYNVAKDSYDFNKEQFDKIEEQIKELKEL